jgi:hypothetical protein
MFGVRHQVVNREAMDNAIDRVLEIDERIEMTPKHYGVFCGEDRVRSIGFHDATYHQN